MTQLLQIPTTEFTTVSCVQSSTFTLRLKHGFSAEYAMAGVMKHALLEKGAGGLSVTFVSKLKDPS